MIPQARPMLKVGGTWVIAHAHYDDIEVGNRRAGGNYSLSWQMNLRSGDRPTWMPPSAPVELHAGGKCWTGTLGDSDWDSGSFTADGLCRQAELAAALDFLDEPTNNLGVALAAAQSRGAVAFSTTEALGSLPGDALEANSLSSLFDQWCLESSLHWGVGADGLMRTSTTDPEAPSLWVLPGIVDLPASSLLEADTVVAQYISPTLTMPKVIATTGTRRRERLVDLRDIGVMDAARAQGIANEILRRGGGGLPRFTSGFEVSPGQVVNQGGRAVDLSDIRADATVRIHGCEDPRTGTPWTDIAIGETSWRPMQRTIQINPVDLDASDFTAIVEELGGTVVF
ncbi:hypothetical protein [Nocardioides alcanivorans]|uniref:hypothetical protein n=1 Tax=Nocardioides alcanivorans TaxID=2897352 RepID=UPI001F3B86CF|nr:hypothetical protein [Nocardioides alcanivorans]